MRNDRIDGSAIDEAFYSYREFNYSKNCITIFLYISGC